MRAELIAALRIRQGLGASETVTKEVSATSVPPLAVQRENYKRWYTARAPTITNTEQLDLMLAQALEEGDEIIPDFAHSFGVKKPMGLSSPSIARAGSSHQRVEKQKAASRANASGPENKGVVMDTQTLVSDPGMSNRRRSGRAGAPRAPGWVWRYLEMDFSIPRSEWSRCLCDLTCPRCGLPFGNALARESVRVPHSTDSPCRFPYAGCGLCALCALDDQFSKNTALIIGKIVRVGLPCAHVWAKMAIATYGREMFAVRDDDRYGGARDFCVFLNYPLLVSYATDFLWCNPLLIGLIRTGRATVRLVAETLLSITRPIVDQQLERHEWRENRRRRRIAA